MATAPVRRRVRLPRATRWRAVAASRAVVGSGGAAAPAGRPLQRLAQLLDGLGRRLGRGRLLDGVAHRQLLLQLLDAPLQRLGHAARTAVSSLHLSANPSRLGLGGAPIRRAPRPS